MKILGLFAAAALVLGAHSASAVTLTNGSFENPIVGGSFATYGNGSSSLDGWTIGGAGIDHIGNYWQASDGNQSLDLSALDAGSISQAISGLTVGQQYTVKFDLAGNPDGDDSVLKEVLVQLDNNIATGQLYTFDTTGTSHGAMGWLTQAYVFIATASTQTLAFVSLTPGSFGPALDNVSVAATPIPGAILLFGSALGGMGFLGYRRKKLAAAA
ncbi:choice-of-anchor C family protein [Dongia sedimenti]|uniref:Choice-of-anchor C family protein n=1 Tax=Dongia sedimenti TaxID=3064282 RepID=A0ABU0YGK4_9PROT|nr:choice-of-anchor C family protein [Rhodospirillaceae bacterium R-7]